MLTPERKPICLLVGDSPTCQTGFGRVSREIGKGLDRLGWDLYCHGFNYSGNPHPIPFLQNRIFPEHVNDLRDVVYEVKPDVVLFIADIWHIHQWQSILLSAGETANVPRVGYFPVDGSSIPRLWTLGVPLLDAVVCYTEFGKEVVYESALALPDELRDRITSRPIFVVPHGVNNEQFYPQMRTHARAHIRGILPEQQAAYLSDELFIVLNANRNQPRKRLDITIEAFAHFISMLSTEDRDRCRLWLHCDPDDPMGFGGKGRLATKKETSDPSSLTELFFMALGRRRIDAYARDGRSRLFITPPILRQMRAVAGEGGVATNVLSSIYNCADVAINTASGEGWGMIAHESAACAIAQVLPNNTVHPEIWGEAFYKIDCPATFNEQENGMLHHLCDSGSAARKLFLCYNDVARREEMSDAVYMVARQEKYRWDVICGQWDNLLRSVIDDSRKRASVASTKEHRDEQPGGDGSVHNDGKGDDPNDLAGVREGDGAGQEGQAC